MISVLINAYAIAPNWGSEQGMGWNWVMQIAQFCKVFVITEGEWRSEIESALENLPQRENIRMYYNPVSPKVRKMCWNQGDYRFYIYYAKWQKKTLEIARSIIKEHKIDVIHQLNMVGFREPGLLWKIKDIPYVWGPFSGCMPVNMAFVKDESIGIKFRYFIKNHVNGYQFRHMCKVRKAFERADALITIDADIKQMVKDYYHKEALIIPETGLQGGCVPLSKMNKRDDGYMNLLWVGRFIKTKKLDIALQTISKLKDKKIRLYVVGFGPKKDEQLYKQLSSDLGVDSMVIWMGKMENSKVKELMLQMDVLFFTSVCEATSTVVPEAIQHRLPIVCHDCCGFGPLINNKIGRKIPLENPSKSVANFANILSELYVNKNLLSDMIQNFDDVAEELTYEYKRNRIKDLYCQVINNRK